MTLEELPRCGALNADGVTRCAAFPMAGEERCHNHGTRQDQRTRQRLRLADLAELAVDRLEEVLRTSQSERTILKAAEIIFDRAGLEPKSGSEDADFARAYITQKLLEMASGERTAVRPQPYVVGELVLPKDDDELTAEDLL